MKKQNNENKHLPITNSNRNDSSAANYLSAENIRLPPYLSKGDPLEALGFPVRLENALKFHGITIVGEFFEEPKDKLIKIRNVGHGSLGYFDEVKKRIREHFGALPNNLSVKAEEASAEEPSIPNDQLITNLLERCGTERVKDVVDRRYGLKNGERQTLEEIGEFYKVTRERIRQIQAKALRRMKHPATKARKPLVALAEKLLYDQGGIITDEEADIEVPRAFDGSGEDGSSVFDLLSDLGWIQSCKIGDFKVYSPAFNGISICRLTEDIVSMIEKENIGIEVYTIIEKISRFGKIKDSRFNPKMFIMRYCRIDPRIEESAIGSGLSHQSDDPDLMVSFRPYTANFSGKGWIVLITRVLESEQMPLHFTEITDKVNDLMGNTGRQIDVRRAHSILVDCEIFAHSGIRGTYGLTSWGLRKESTPQLIEECLKKAGFPLHWKQIFNYVSKFKNTKPENIISVLKFNKTFGEQGKGIYWFKKGRA